MSQDPERELVYFDIRGRAESIRLLLAYARAPYVDRGIPRADWPSLKKTVPLGQVPVLLERSSGGERVIPQSQAILRHLARVFGLDGTSEDERVRADIVAETVVELRAAWNRVAYNPGWLNDQAATDAHFRDVFPRFRALLEGLLEQSEERGALYFAGPTPTHADFLAFDTLESHREVVPSCLDGHGSLQRFLDDVRALPPIADYLARRRPSDFPQRS
ncbi:glutathione S-transferase family protein [Polyangium sp. 15x6]|uniref:glutathione S-transferase family protein n=1 Tax=Polyangium sp. 15x6 TaxID=3042687 RepID=UPI00249A6BA0|nr:glutathione S-transferase family protein [Polyangium sp. 15x6]MDI3290186.1 glutathione S-transferase family protein [Polyangium sp. 15x6]